MLSLEQKIGQLMMVGWQSSDYNDIIEQIKNYHFGNVILFTRNIKSASQLKEVCAKIQEAAIEYNGVPAFISIDQEGGSVRRIYDGVTTVPGHMAIAAASFKNTSAASKVGKIIGEELRSLGVNMDLAPVVDVNSNPQNPVIGIRAFSDSPEYVAKLASDFYQAMQKEGVLSCYKHFIGHGDVNVDSHIDLPYLSKSYEEIKKCELVPYLVDDLPDAVMTSHILYKDLDSRFPASISSRIIKDLLREQLNYQGLVVTDCFEMVGLARTFALEQAAVFAIKAGTDIITVSHTLGKQLIVRSALLDAVKNNNLSIEEVDRAVNNIIAYKKKYCNYQEKEIDFSENKRISEAISLDSITVASGEIFDIDDNTVVIGVTNYVNSIAEDTNVENMDIAQVIGEKYQIPHRSIDNRNFNVNEMLAFARNHKVILALTDSHLTLVQRVLYTTLIQNGLEIMLISLRTPYDVVGQDLPACHICLYEYTKLSVNSLLKVLEKKKTNGRLPVRLNTKQDITNPNGIHNYLIKSIINYINQNYAKNLNLNNVADEFLISSGHLCRLFKEALGINFIDYLNTVRIGKAKELLSNTNLRVYEVANLCGIVSFNYFCKLFRRYVGVTPTYYKNNHSIND